MEKEAALPKNVRQIGDIRGNRRIYMEDYVMTYIHRKEQQEEQGFLGVFLGEKRETEEGTLLFIRGLVEVPGEDVEEQSRPQLKDQRETWTEERNTEREEQKPRGQRDRYFAGQERSKKQKEMYAGNIDEDPDWEKAEEILSADRADETGEIPDAERSSSIERSSDTRRSSETERSSDTRRSSDTERSSDTKRSSDTEEIWDAGEDWDSEKERGRIGGKRTVLEECREFFGPCEIQGCCVIGEYPVKRMERLADEIPGTRQFLYHLQEQEETLYWMETEKYEQISGYFVFYELNREMQEYMSEMFSEEESEQNRVPDKAIKNFREKIRKKDQIRLTGMLKLASSFFVVTVLVIGAVAVNRIGAGRGGDTVIEAPENEAQNQLSPTRESAVMLYSDTGTDPAENMAGSGETGNTDGSESQPVLDAASTLVSGTDAAAVIQNGIASAGGLSGQNGTGETGEQVTQSGTGGGSETGAVTASGSDSSTGTGAASDVVSDSGAVTTSGSASGTSAGTASNEVSGSDAGTGTASGSASGTSAGTASGGVSDSGVATASGSASGTGTGTDSNGVSGTDAGTGTASGNASDSGAAAGNNRESEAAAAAGITTEENGMTGSDGAETVQTAGTAAGNDGTAQTGGTAAGNDGAVQTAGTAAGNDGTAQTGGTAAGNDGTAQAGGTAAGNGKSAQTRGSASGKEDEAAEVSARQVNASYVIREGDTLADICQTYYGGLDKLALICEANGIENADMIMPGQKIVLP